MAVSQRFFTMALCLLTGTMVSSIDGPVFINPDIALQAVVAVPKSDNLVTQTVYGFLDFTTTIGNTIMVFSPQSVAPLVPEVVTSKTVIETKPITTKEDTQQPIKPSKTLVEKKASDQPKKMSSVVQIQSSSPQSQKVEIKSSPSTKVNVIENKPSSVKPPVIASKVAVIEGPASSKVEVVTGSDKVTPKPEPTVTSKVEIVSSVVQVKSDEEPAFIVGNNIGEPEYDFLSRQPSEVVEETYKLINLKSNSKFHLKPRATAEAAKNKATKRADTNHVTGLVTKLGGTVVKDGVTTVHETSVIGTYISGKYAQVLQSTSHIYNKGKINPSQTLRILKTAAPSLNKGNKNHRQQQQHLEPTPAVSSDQETVLAEASQKSIKTTRKSVPFKPRFKNRPKEQEVVEYNVEQAVVTQPSYKKTTKNRNNGRTAKHNTSSQRPQKFGRTNRGRKTATTTTPSAHSEEPTTAAPKRFSGRRNKQNKAPASNAALTEASTNSNGGFSRRGYKPRVQPSAVEQNSVSTSLYKFKLNRSPGRWQYKTTAKPRVTIRKQNDDDVSENETSTGSTSSTVPKESQQTQNKDAVTPQARSDDVDGLEGSESIATIIDDESATENKLDTPVIPLETIKVEISTPPDFKDIYYEIATIKSPYTFQVGSVKNTRFITVTSTFEKSITSSTDPALSSISPDEPLTENILATTNNYDKDNNFLDSSIVTLPPLYLASDMETPPLETLTETFSTTQTMLKTHILPVVRNGNSTETSTLVQTYLVTRLVTATKTLPPMEAYQFIPSKTLNEFNSRLDEAGSELHLELEFGDQNDQDDEGSIRKVFAPDFNLADIGSNFDISDVDKTKIEKLRPKKVHKQNEIIPQPQQPALNPDQLQQLAFLRLLNPAAAQQGQVITTSRPVLKVETVYETHVLPVTQGQNTILSTISKIKGTFTKTDYEFGTSTIAPALQIPQIPQIPQLPQIPQINPLFPQAQPQFTVTSSPVVTSTMVTQTNSKILKLTFGAKTAQTTVFSTTVIPTLVTSYVTASLAVAPTAAAYPGYFPAPFPGYPYVG